MALRTGAVVISIYLLILIGLLFRSAGTAQLRGLTGLLTLVLVVQIVLGLSNVYWQIPATIAVPHNAGGALLLLVLVALNYYLFTASRGVDNG